MKFLRHQIFSALFSLGSLLLLANSSVEGRVGESRTELERRLLNSGGIVYRDENIKSNRLRGMPYMKYMDFMPDSIEIRIYYKSEDGRKPKSSDMEEKRVHPGWDIHVLYVRGISVLEVYKRSQPMTDPEMKLLLTTLAQGSYWKKVESKGSDKEVAPSAFGFNMERKDGKVRGKRVGQDMVIVFDVDFDSRLAEMQILDDQEQAPISVNGF